MKATLQSYLQRRRPRSLPPVCRPTQLKWVTSGPLASICQLPSDLPPQPVGANDQFRLDQNVIHARIGITT